MGNRSSPPGQVISLPTSGGALRGLGEKFSPDLHTGTGNFTVPLALPPGRNGFQPQLNLVYSTGAGNGPFGLGWSLSVPGVSRKTSKGVPHYDDAQDVFILSGAEDLVPVERPAPGLTRYQPRTEGLFARLLHHRDPRNDYWEAQSKDGLVSVYGAPQLAGNDPSVLGKPGDPARVFAWKLTETRDPFGNRIRYEYVRDRGAQDGHAWDQPLLRRIRYADYDAPDGIAYLISVAFDYADRPDPFSEYRAGFEIRTTQRCARILVQTHAGQDRAVREYRFHYEHDPHNGVSLLKQIEVAGFEEAGAPVVELPPLEFGYTRFEPEKRRFEPLRGDLAAGSLADPGVELADLFGNGLPDILEMNGAVRYWRNLGQGRFDESRLMRDAPAGLALADPGVQLVDADGDGRADLLATQAGLTGYFPLRFDGGWDRRSFQPYRQAPSFDLEDPEVKLVDLDGDGVTDAVRSGARLECFFNDPRTGWAATRWVERQALDVFPDVSFSDPRVKLGDMSGDGLQDIVLIHDGSVAYWPNLGRGDWGRRLHMRHSPRLPHGYDPRRILLGDVDGDGLADLVYVDHGRVTLWINQNGNGWSDPITITGTPPLTDAAGVRLADLYGGGISGVLWSTDAPGLARRTLWFLDVSGGGKPYLLNQIDNHLGAVTKVQYASSTRFYLEDEKQPQTRWRTPLPFPVQVVARVEVVDEISRGKLTTEYRYHHGYWDGAEREYRGFGLVEQLDSETFDDYHAAGPAGAPARFAAVPPTYFSPPTLTKTWFHQGPVGDEFGDWQELDYAGEYWPGDPPLLDHTASVNAFLKTLTDRRVKRDALRTLRGRSLRTELYALDGAERQDRPYTVTELAHGLREEAAPGPGEAGRSRVFFPHQTAQRTTQWERGDDPLTQFTFTDDYDAYGQPRRQTQIACPRGWRTLTDTPGAPYLATRTRTEYAAPVDSGSRYCVDRVARTTTYEATNSSGQTLSTLSALPDDNPALRVIGQILQFYDGEAFQGLPLFQIGAYGALARALNLVLTGDLLPQAYGAEPPPYLTPGPAPNWTNEYPTEFRALPALAGYVYSPAGGTVAGYYAAREQRRYDFHADSQGRGRGLMRATRDPLGRETAITYDAYELLPIQVADPAGLTTRAAYDYRVLQPREVTDPNGNQSAFTFSPMGLLKEGFVRGQAAGEGDQRRPGVRLAYDWRAFYERRQPIFVRTTRHIHHDTDTNTPQPERDETIESVEYSDGFGRLLQTRTQAEDILFGDAVLGGDLLPANQGADAGARRDVTGTHNADAARPNVVVSGWQVFDNKGRVVEKYEPLFDVGWEYDPPHDQQPGQKATRHYDPRGQAIRTVNPDGSEQRVIYGVPADLGDPERYTPTPWEVYTYDANDNAGRTHPTTASGYRHHWNTPASSVRDALGRTAQAIARNRAQPALPGDPPPPVEEYRTTSTYDIRGNPLTVTDALGRVAFRYIYDLADRPLRIESIDAGLRRTVRDAAGNVVEQRDGKGALVLRAYDVLNRLTRLWARDGADQPLTLRARLTYGDSPESGLTAEQARAANLLGKPYRQYDEAGLLTFAAYDFKGNHLEKVRQVIADAALLAVFNPPPPDWKINAFCMDWGAANADDFLDPTEYHTTTTYDALNRIRALRCPQDVDGQRQELRPRYNRAGALERVELEGAVYVERLAYNAKGQRTLITYGNGVMTRHAYDARTFRLSRLRTERFTAPAPLTYQPAGAPLQDFAYDYDLAGNILAIHDRPPGGGLPGTPTGPDALDRAFTYDPLHRLLSATGREHARLPPAPPWDDAVQTQDPTLTRGYTEHYEYDRVGNITRMRHQANGGSFTRDFALAPNSNRLVSVAVGATAYGYAYDANGNLISEGASRHCEWDHADRMKGYRTQAGTAEPSVHAHYLYDAGGQRAKKLVRKQGGAYEVTIYIDGLFEHHRRVQGGATQANNTLHVMDTQNRIALVRVGAPFPDDASPAVKYHLGDHLGSSHLVLGADGAWVNREEYTPYGETSFGGFARKRYRFTGQERDEENGLNYHGARYYAPWLARWVSCDPKGMVDGANLYGYSGNSPLRFVDPTGTEKRVRTPEPAVRLEVDLVVTPTEARENWLFTVYDPKTDTLNWVRSTGPQLAGGLAAEGELNLPMGGAGSPLLGGERKIGLGGAYTAFTVERGRMRGTDLAGFYRSETRTAGGLYARGAFDGKVGFEAGAYAVRTDYRFGASFLGRGMELQLGLSAGIEGGLKLGPTSTEVKLPFTSIGIAPTGAFCAACVESAEPQRPSQPATSSSEAGDTLFSKIEAFFQAWQSTAMAAPHAGPQTSFWEALRQRVYGERRER